MLVPLLLLILWSLVGVFSLLLAAQGGPTLLTRLLQLLLVPASVIMIWFKGLLLLKGIYNYVINGL